jgi:hypothetical protein
MGECDRVGPLYREVTASGRVAHLCAFCKGGITRNHATHPDLTQCISGDPWPLTTYCLNVSIPRIACCLAISDCTPWRASPIILPSCGSSNT